ncbi:hypothetical protein CDAR_249941 [Caerostris darwini]|uniref:Uncharacterized protein n=1 Tax=Caerostris darwini TaxID=1538125 RepID=A0AAV4NIA5_9ARAC|nr:hypothetical protein CDAR_249941 [Caerostris darwini]
MVRLALPTIPCGCFVEFQKSMPPISLNRLETGDTYRVTQLGEKCKGHSYSTTSHVNQLKAWPTQTDSDREDSSDEPADFSDNDFELRRNPRRACIKIIS